jgi:hypothetical protein
MPAHWYFITIEECVLCGTTRITRERRYGKKPPIGSGSTHEFIQFGCQGHFL